MTPDLTGRRFGRWTVLGKTDTRTMWECRCDCGTLRAVNAKNMQSGGSKSCGCLHRQIAAESSRTHGAYGTPLHTRWLSMLSRVTNPNQQRTWANYGGRGITVCDRWRKFENFAEDMGPTFVPGLELDRIDNDGGYEPGNCRWATLKEQARNRRNNRRVEVDGLTLTAQEWGERLGINPDNIRRRLRDGWSVERALEPGDGRGRRGQLLEFGGIELTVAEWADRAGIDRLTIYSRLRHGWSVERALTAPVQTKAPRP